LALNGTHQLLVYDNSLNKLGECTCTIKGNTESLVASKKTGVGVHAEKTRYMVMSEQSAAQYMVMSEQSAAQYHNVKRGNELFKGVERRLIRENGVVENIWG
jgi:hypothetical protein